MAIPVLKKISEYLLFKDRKFLDDDSKQSVLYLIGAMKSGKRVFQIISGLLYSGYRCCVAVRFGQWRKLREGSRKTILLDNVYPAKKKYKYAAVISNNKKVLEKCNLAPLKIYINFDIFEHLNDVTDNDLFRPIPLAEQHNNVSTEANILSKSLAGERKIGAILIGNTQDYDKAITKELLEINTRGEVFECIRTSLPEVYIPETFDELVLDMNKGLLKNKIVIIDTASKFRIPGDKYFDILLDSSFFIHTSGHIQPYCYNQIESMLAGCIPITQFARFYIPAFQHEENSLLYNTLNELVELLKKVTSGYYANKTETMRGAIVNYYKKYHSLESFKTKLSYLIDNKIEYANYYVATGIGYKDMMKFKKNRAEKLS